MQLLVPLLHHASLAVIISLMVKNQGKLKFGSRMNMKLIIGNVQLKLPESQVFHHEFSAQHRLDLHDQQMPLLVSQFLYHLAGSNIFFAVNW